MTKQANASTIQRRLFGTIAANASQASGEQNIEAICLSNSSGMSVTILTYGATIQSLIIPGAQRPADIVLGHDMLAPYLEKRRFYGATIGRFANRIGTSRFILEGAEYQIEANEGANSLHGGFGGFDRVNWSVSEWQDGENPSVTLIHTSPDGAGGYPGELTTAITYCLSGQNALSIDYQASTTKPTVINLTNHSFFNLGGEGQPLGILDHMLQVEADAILVTDAEQIPDGTYFPVAETALDFTSPARLRERVANTSCEPIRIGGGIDHAFCLRGACTVEPRLVASLSDPVSGNRMEVLTTQPSLQIYTGNRIAADPLGKNAMPYQPHHAICLETQHYPDSPNHPHFPTTGLNPGDHWQHTTIYRFTTA